MNSLTVSRKEMTIKIFQQCRKNWQGHHQQTLRHCLQTAKIQLKITTTKMGNLCAYSLHNVGGNIIARRNDYLLKIIGFRSRNYNAKYAALEFAF